MNILKKTRFFLWAWGLLCLSLTACNNKEENTQPQLAKTTPALPTFNMYVVDKDTGENLIGTTGQPYHPDVIKIDVLVSNTYTEENNGILDLDSDGEYIIQQITIPAFLPNLEAMNYTIYLQEGEIEEWEIHYAEIGLAFYHNDTLLLTHNYSMGTIPTITLKR